MFPYEDSKTMSVRPYPEKRNHPSFVNNSPTLVIDTSMERSSRILHHGNPKNVILFKKKKKKILIFIRFKYFNFSDAAPSPCEEDIYRDVNLVLEGSRIVIAELQDYKGAAKEIREVGIVLYMYYIYLLFYCPCF